MFDHENMKITDQQINKPDCRRAGQQINNSENNPRQR